MKKINSKAEFLAIFSFLAALVLLLSNGFIARLSAQQADVDVYRELEPIGTVLDIVLREYVREVDIEKVVEGALSGIMTSLDRNSAFISAKELEALREETKGEFDGIGVSIRLDDAGNIIVFQPILNSPAYEAGIRPFDIILAIDGVSTQGMDTAAAAELIRGKRGTYVSLKMMRLPEGETEQDIMPEEFEVRVKRARIPLESVKEAQLLKKQVGYVRINSFSDTTAADLAKWINEFLEKGMQSFILDLRWNSGGLLSASKEVCELFLPRGSLVTYTRGRTGPDGSTSEDDMRLITSSRPILPPAMPMIVLVNKDTASSSEIVTGALQYHQRAIVLGEKTFGKGSVQTIIPLSRPKDSGLRLTTALYYTPADVTIDNQGILPDVEVTMTREQEFSLAKQMYDSYERNPENQYKQNHGSVTDYEITEGTVEDLPLLRAVEILTEDSVWDNLLRKYHRDVRETQMTANVNTATVPQGTVPASQDENPFSTDEVHVPSVR